MISTVPKILALTFSLLLGGGYVWYRAGGSIPYFAPAKQSNTQPDVTVPPDVVERAELGNFYESIKSGRVLTKNDLLDLNFKVKSNDSLPADKRVILPGSKMGAIEFHRITEKESPKPEPRPPVGAKPVGGTEAAPTPLPKKSEEPRKRTLLPGSKVLIDKFLIDDEKFEKLQIEDAKFDKVE